MKAPHLPHGFQAEGHRAQSLCYGLAQHVLQGENSLLHLAQLHPDNQLRLGRHVLKHIGLQPPEHVRSQKVMKFLDLVLLGDVCKLFQEALQVAVDAEDGLWSSQGLAKAARALQHSKCHPLCLQDASCTASLGGFKATSGKGPVASWPGWSSERRLGRAALQHVGEPPK